jgi:hypothetical protein
MGRFSGPKGCTCRSRIEEASQSTVLRGPKKRTRGWMGSADRMRKKISFLGDPDMKATLNLFETTTHDHVASISLQPLQPTHEVAGFRAKKILPYQILVSIVAQPQRGPNFPTHPMTPHASQATNRSVGGFLPMSSFFFILFFHARNTYQQLACMACGLALTEPPGVCRAALFVGEERRDKQQGFARQGVNSIDQPV